jgi:threonine aldolase
MRAALERAETGRYLPEEDPEAAALEAEAAELLGHEEGLFMPTATMANLVALLVHTQPDDLVAVLRDSHLLVAEGGGFTAIARVCTHESETADVATLLALLNRLKSKPKPVLVWLENTHTRSGGSVTSPGQLNACATFANRVGARLHVDGARLPNAAAALHIPWRDLAAPADSVTLSLNKGLGAPVGAILAGSASLVREARLHRERLGGAWRKPGHLAAAGRFALQTPTAVLERDHSSAARIAKVLATVPGCIVQAPKTNIVHGSFVDAASADRFLSHLKRREILGNLRRPTTVRLVTHSAVGDMELAHVIATVNEYATRPLGGASASALPARAR